MLRNHWHRVVTYSIKKLSKVTTVNSNFSNLNLNDFQFFSLLVEQEEGKSLHNRGLVRKYYNRKVTLQITDLLFT